MEYNNNKSKEKNKKYSKLSSTIKNIRKENQLNDIMNYQYSKNKMKNYDNFHSTKKLGNSDSKFNFFTI